MIDNEWYKIMKNMNSSNFAAFSCKNNRFSCIDGVEVIHELARN